VRQGFPLGRVLGVAVTGSWSLLVIVGLVAIGLAGGVLPAEAPGVSGGWYALAGIVTAVAFVATIAAHEIGHAVVARRQGLEVGGIMLWALGGLTSIEGEPATPAGELALSGVGPLISFLLGLALVVMAVGLHLAGAPSLLAVSIGWLGGMNVLLAVLNVLPASPLDGGRMLHAFVWKATGDRLRATRVATGAGRVLGVVLVVGGVGALLYGYTYGIWVAITGWFLAAGASAERRSALATAGLGDRRVRDLMTPVAVIPDWLSVETTLADGSLSPARPVAVTERWGGGPSGLVTLSHVLALSPEWHRDVRIRDLAWPIEQLVTVRPDELLADVVTRMSPAVPWAIVVDSSGRIEGALSATDVALLAQSGSRPPRPRAASGGGWTTGWSDPSPNDEPRVPSGAHHWGSGSNH
jgi:Zn-dependent protease